MRVKVVCVGGGPAGLYLAILLKRQDPSHDVTVHERNPEGRTYGWGVTYWRGLLDKLRAYDPETARAIEAHSVRWTDGVARVRGLTTRHRGDEGFGIGRHRLLDLLAGRARALGVRLEFESEPTEPPAGADLVVAAAGVDSALRGGAADRFGTRVTTGRNPGNWLGTT
ncbi:NAD(P)-binding protein, partial [Streptomyces tricolor]